MARFKIGIIGVGKLGNYHCNAVSQLADAELAGVYDVDKDRKVEIAQQYHCTPFPTQAELIDACDVVGVIVPTIHHLSVVREVLASGKPVFVEKPIAATLPEAQEMVSLSESLGVPVQVGHIERFNPAIRALEGYKLAPLFIESHRLAPFDPRGTDVAVILDLMIHDIDIILSMVNSPVADIHANGVAIVSDEVDIANARIEFANGCVANVTASRISQRKMRKMRLFQSNAYISIDFLLKLTEVFRLADGDNGVPSAINLGLIEKGKYRKSILYEKPPVPELDAMQAEWNSFLHAIEKGELPIISARDGRDALEIAMKIREKVSSSSLLKSE
jgi:predicted dehydrogenase